MTAQETFDYIVVKLRKQGRKSAADGTCLYRAPDGCKCAAGWCIPDEDYLPEMEGLGVRSRPRIRQLLDRDGYDLNTVVALQRAHDTSDSSNFLLNFLLGARVVAEKMGLDPAVAL